MSFKNENQRSKSVGHPLPSSIVAVAIVLVVNAGFSMGRLAFGRQCVIIDNRDDIIMFNIFI